jgi:hypothetical protein
MNFAYLTPSLSQREKKKNSTEVTAKMGKTSPSIASLLAAIKLELSMPMPSLVSERKTGRERKKEGGARVAAFVPVCKKRLLVSPPLPQVLSFPP